MIFTDEFLSEVSFIADNLDTEAIDKMVEILESVRRNRDRLFILGVGGSAANASHAVNDFRKICGIEAYAPTDNVAELTARTNDDGWDTVFVQWLRTSQMRSGDAILVLSVSGGNDKSSPNLLPALSYAKQKEACILGIVGKTDGDTAKLAHTYVLVPQVNTLHHTALSEIFQSVIWHLIANHPRLSR